MTLSLRKNFARGLLAADINEAVTQIVLSSGHTLPTAAGSFPLVIWDHTTYPDPADDLNLEIVTASYSGTLNTYNIVRAQEDTVVSSHSSQDRVALHFTAQMSTDDLANHTHAAMTLNTAHRLGDGSDHTYIDQNVTTTGSPTFAGLTLTNASVIGSNSVVFQPSADSTTFMQAKAADASIIWNVDSSNKGIVLQGSAVYSALAAMTVYDSLIVLKQTEAKGRINFLSENDEVNYCQLECRSSTEASALWGITLANWGYVRAAGTTLAGLAFGTTQNDAPVVFGTANVERVRILGTGEFGVGLSAPLNIFHAEKNQSGAVSYLAVGNNGAAASSGQGISFKYNTTQLASIQNIYSGSRWYVRHYVWTGAAEVEFFTGTYTGGEARLGVNESNPFGTFHISSAGTPRCILENITEEDADGGREGEFIWRGRQSGGEQSYLAWIKGSHDGLGDDQKGQVVIGTNAGTDDTTPTSHIKLDSAGATYIGDGGITNYTQVEADGDIVQKGTGRFIESSKFKLTSIGGLAVKLTNKTGSNTVAGQLVKADAATDDGVVLTAAGDVECIGVFLDSGVADDSEAWVVVAGIADVAMEDNTAATSGNWVQTSDLEAGYADATAGSPAAAPGHFEEIGHCIESVSAGGGGTHILARCVLHFN